MHFAWVRSAHFVIGGTVGHSVTARDGEFTPVVNITLELHFVLVLRWKRTARAVKWLADGANSKLQDFVERKSFVRIPHGSRRTSDERPALGSLAGGAVLDLCHFIVKFTELGECGSKRRKTATSDRLVKIRRFSFGGRPEGHGSHVMPVAIRLGVCTHGVKPKHFTDIRNCRMAGERRKNIFATPGSPRRLDYSSVANLTMTLDWCLDLSKSMT